MNLPRNNYHITDELQDKIRLYLGYSSIKMFFLKRSFKNRSIRLPTMNYSPIIKILTLQSIKINEIKSFYCFTFLLSLSAYSEIKTFTSINIALNLHMCIPWCKRVLM